jgi:hypothetical protein
MAIPFAAGDTHPAGWEATDDGACNHGYTVSADGDAIDDGAYNHGYTVSVEEKTAPRRGPVTTATATPAAGIAPAWRHPTRGR